MNQLREIIELRQLTSALIGAGLALGGQVLLRRVSRARTAKALCTSFWEELGAVHFYGPEDKANFAIFSSQTFDTLFREMAESLPESLTRDLDRYHWRMKYLESTKPVVLRDGSGGLNPQFWREAKGLHERLRERLDHYSKRKVLSIFLRATETCDRSLLKP